MYRMPTEPQDVGGVLDSGFALFRAGWRQVLALAVLAGVVAGAWRLVDDSIARMLEGGAPAPVGWPALALMVLGGLASMYLYLGVVARLAALAAGRAISLRTALWRALRRYVSLLICLFVLFVALVAPLIVVTIALVGAITGVFGGGAWLLSALLVALVAAAAVLMVYWYFALLLLITRNVGAIAALRGSFALVRGHWWRTVAILVVAYFITLTALVVVGVAAAGLGALAGLANLRADALVFLVQALGSGITTPFMIAVSLLALNDLEVRRRGADLAARIEAAAK